MLLSDHTIAIVQVLRCVSQGSGLVGVLLMTSRNCRSSGLPKVAEGNLITGAASVRGFALGNSQIQKKLRPLPRSSACIRGPSISWPHSLQIAVAYDSLKWSNEPPRSTTASTTTSSPNARPATNVDSDRRSASDGTVRTTGAATTTDDRKANGYWYPDHAIYNGTKDQLKAMPQFKY